jgi:hypothetical protein
MSLKEAHLVRWVIEENPVLLKWAADLDEGTHLRA